MAVRSEMDHADAGTLTAAPNGEGAAIGFMATATASGSQRRFAVGIVAISAVLFAAALPFVSVKLAQVPAFIPAYESALIVNDLITAVLLLGQFTKLRSTALLILAAGYLFDVLIIVPHALSFPGVFGPGGIIGGGHQTTAWLYIFWHSGFPLFVIAYALLRDRSEFTADAGTAPYLPLAAASFVVVVVAALTVIATAGDNLLPPIIQGTGYTSVAFIFLGASWVFSLAAIVILWQRGLRSVLDVWITVVMCTWAFDVALSAVFNSGRYDLGFYAGRAYGLLASSFVLIVVLLETSGLFSRLAETAARLTTETRKLRGDARQSAQRQQETEEQLRQAQKMEAIGNLTGGLAHDFNNLLAIVIGNLDMLVSEKKSDPEVQELGKEALDAALQGADLTKRLLAFARRQPLQPTLLDLNTLVTAHAKLLRRLLGATIDVELDLAPDVWPTIADPTQLEAAITNLATNARDAMPKGGRLVIATANRRLDQDYADSHPEVAAGEYAAIEVTDTGSGISPDVLHRVFEPFFTTKGAGKGSGLGLSMIFGFMKQSKGHVNVYSEPGIGTTFRLYLPRVTQTPAVAAPTAVAAPQAHAGGGETVLAVEDVALLRQVVVRQLGELGYRVLEADSATTALAVLEKQPVDVLFTDVIIAGGATGFDLARAARARWPSLRVVFTSGFPDARLANGAPGSFTGKLLGKPFRKDDLAKALREALDAPPGS